jgi:hypothetical protein
MVYHLHVLVLVVGLYASLIFFSSFFCFALL